MNMDTIPYQFPGRDIHVLRIVKSNSGPIAYRFFGIFEGVFTPSCSYLMAIYYGYPDIVYCYLCCLPWD